MKSFIQNLFVKTTNNYVLTNDDIRATNVITNIALESLPNTQIAAKCNGATTPTLASREIFKQQSPSKSQIENPVSLNDHSGSLLVFAEKSEQKTQVVPFVESHKKFAIPDSPTPNQRECIKLKHVGVLESWRRNPEAGGNKTEAARRILEALNTDASKLSLVGLRLTLLPIKVIESLRLMRLSLDHNSLTTFSAESGSFPLLKRLFLCHNPLKSFSVKRDAFPDLEWLDLSATKLTELPLELARLNRSCAVFTAENCLTQQSLIAIRRAIEQARKENPRLGPESILGENILGKLLTDQIFAPRSLRNQNKPIRLQHEITEELSNWIKNRGTEKNRIEAAIRILEAFHTNAETLTLDKLDLTLVPSEAIVYLSGLKTIDLSNNFFTNFATESSCFPKLNWLKLSNNSLTTFSTEGTSFPNLIELYLDHNSLTNFTAKQDFFPSLELLSLSNNLLTSFSVERGCFPNLNWLKLSNNSLTSFSTEKDFFLSLKGLDLSNNSLRHFLIAGHSFPSLTGIDLSTNLLMELSYELAYLSKFCLLRAENNLFSEQAYRDFHRKIDQTRKENPQLGPNWRATIHDHPLYFWASEVKMAFPLKPTDFYRDILSLLSEHEKRSLAIYLQKLRATEDYRNAITRNNIILDVHTMLENINSSEESRKTVCSYIDKTLTS